MTKPFRLSFENNDVYHTTGKRRKEDRLVLKKKSGSEKATIEEGGYSFPHDVLVSPDRSNDDAL